LNKPAPTVSLCMIVRDEEENLPLAVESVRPLVDDLVICDTGSTDGTCDVARELGADLVEFPWCDDFSAARNAALEAVRSDWVLVLDADEILQPVCRDEFRHCLADPLAAGYELAVISQRPEGDQRFSLVRLFRNHPTVRFCFPIHEQVVPSLNDYAAERGMKVLSSPFTIRHSGYTAEARAAKRPRNRRIFEQALAHYPDEPYLHFQAAAEDVLLLGGEVLPVAGFREAMAGLERAWELTADWDETACRQAPWYSDLAHLLGSSRMLMGDLDGAMQVLGQAAPLHPEFEPLAQTFCLLLVEMGLRDRGLLQGLTANITAQAVILPVAGRHRVLGNLELVLGHVELARAHFEALAREERFATFANLGLARCCLKEAAYDRSLAFFLKAVQASEWNWQAWQQGAQVMDRLNLTERADNWREVFHKNFPEHPQVLAAADAEKGEVS
jgi:tetratricopeptide (TPR) repeat protein